MARRTERGGRMKITLELPDNTEAAFINYACRHGLQINLVSKGIDTNDLKAGYKDCREYEVNKDENA